MEYLNRDELVRLFKVARQHNPLHHVALLVGLLHGLRVSETLAIRGRDICDGKPCRAWRCRAGKLPNELNINLPHDPLRPLHGGVTFGKSAQLG